MSYGIKLHIWGERALFTRPEMKVERVSYDVITPSAGRGILEAIHWKPAIRWVVDSIQVLKPIRFESIRRNEVGGKLSAANIGKAMKAGRTDGLVNYVEDAPCVKIVVAPIDSTLGGRGQRIGSIRTSIQGQGGGAAVAA